MRPLVFGAPEVLDLDGRGLVQRPLFAAFELDIELQILVLMAAEEEEEDDPADDRDQDEAHPAVHEGGRHGL